MHVRHAARDRVFNRNHGEISLIVLDGSEDIFEEGQGKVSCSGAAARQARSNKHQVRLEKAMRLVHGGIS
jgi:hypothetical protein